MNMISELAHKNRKELGMFALLVVLCIWTIFGSREAGVDTLFNSKFLTADNLTNVCRQIGFFGIFSIGVGLVIITSGIELSVGSMMSLLGVVFIYSLTGHTFEDTGLSIPEMPWPVGVLVTLLLGTLIGLFHGFFIANVKMQAFVVTLCGLLSYRGLSRFIANDTAVYHSSATQNISVLRRWAEESIFGLPMSFFYLIIIAIVMFLLLHKSVFGRYIYAVGRNELATKYSGINTKLVIASVYVICGFLTAFSAILFIFYTDGVSPSNHGAFFELYAIAAAVLGGCSLRGGEGSIIGILIGTTILIVLQNMINLLNYPSSLADFIIGGFIFCGVLIDQIGIKGFKSFLGKFKSSKT